MSEFKFLCPECGQKIACDSGISGNKIACPACQKSLTVPSDPSVAPVPVTTAPPPPVRAPVAPRPVPASSSVSKPPEADPSHYSWLAIASLVSSVFVFFGFIPGIICGHMAKAKMRKDIFLEGEKMANAGLAISYCVLLVVLCFATVGFANRMHYHPRRTVLASADATIVPASQVVDDVQVDKTEEDHGMDGQVEGRPSLIGAEKGRKTLRGGYVSYTMKVLPDAQMILNCRYWGGEPKGRLFDVAIDDQVIATQKLDHDYPTKFFDVEYKIPTDLTRGKTKVTVAFQAHAECTAGTLYGCQMLKQ